MAEERIHISAGGALMLALLPLFCTPRLLCALLPAVALHEGFHLLALRLCGARFLQLRIELAGLCLHSTAVSSRGEEVFCTLAGPVGGLLWAGAAAPFWPLSAGVSLLLSLFNLLPALPLDGGRALLALTGQVGLLRFSTALSALLLLALALWAPLPPMLIPALWLWTESIKA